MQINIAQIFPISDVTSARLMKLKAACLFRAGVLTLSQRAAVDHRANEILHGRPPHARRPSYHSKAA
jgi:hypothetical protein